MKDIHALACCHRKWKFNEIRKNLINIKLSNFECIPHFLKNYGPQNKHHELNKLEINFNYENTQLIYALQFVSKIKYLKINILKKHSVDLSFTSLRYCFIEHLKIFSFQKGSKINIGCNEKLLSFTSDFSTEIALVFPVLLDVVRCRSSDIRHLRRFFNRNDAPIVSHLIIESNKPQPFKRSAKVKKLSYCSKE